MRILYLSPNFPVPTNTGAKTRIYNILSRLAKKNEIVFACVTQDYVSPDQKQKIQSYCIDTQIVKLPSRNIIKKGKLIFHTDPYHARYFYSNIFKNRLSILFEKYNFELIYCHFLYMAQYLDHRLSGEYSMVIDQHNSDTLMWRRMSTNSSDILFKIFAWQNMIKTRVYERKNYSKFDLCLSVSREDARMTRNIAKSKPLVVVAPNGVDVKKFRPDPYCKKLKNSVLFFGTLNAQMNVDAIKYYVEDILPIVKTQIPEVKTILVGKDPVGELRRLSKIEGVELIGEVTDIREYINIAELVIAPIRFGAGTKLKVLESMAMEKAVVATQLSCQGIDTIDGDNIVVADSPEKFAQKVVYLLRNKSLRNRIGKNARQTIQNKYSWDYIVTKIEREIKKIIGESRQ